MGWAEGLLGGFVDRKREYEAEQLDLAARRSDRESRIYQTLLSSPDPEIQSLAAAGLLESAAGPKKKGGLSGWLGQMEESAVLPRIQALVGTPVLGTEQIAGPPTLPSTSTTGYLATPPPVSGSLAQSTGSPTEGEPLAHPMPVPLTPLPGGLPTGTGAEPPLKVDETVTAGVDTTPPSALTRREVPSRPTTTTRPVFKPRQVFLTPEQATLQQKRGAARGDVEGEVAGLVAAGFTEEEARALVAKKYERRYGAGTGADRSIFGEILQPDGKWVSGSVVFDPQTGKHFDTQTGEPVLGFRRNTVTGSASAPTDARRILQEMFPGKQLSDLTAEEAARLNTAVAKYGGVKAGETTAGRMEAAAAGPLDVNQRTTQTNTLVKQWEGATESSRQVNRQWLLMQASLDRYDADPPGASQGVLVTFQKILDPPSVVRESEYARSAYGLSLMQWLDGMRERYQHGGAGVPKPVLAQMVKTAATFVTAQNISSGLENVKGRIQAQAIASEIPPELVFGQDPYAGTGIAPAPSGPVGTPPPGAMQAAPPPPPAGAAPIATPPPAPITPVPSHGRTTAPAAPPAPGGAQVPDPSKEWQHINGVMYHYGKPY